MSCCPNGLDDVFTEKFSRRDAKRYRKRGLPGRARRLLRALESVTSLKELRTLEVGAGAGAVTVEMLRRGAQHATAVDAVAAQLDSARRLAEEFSVGDRAEFVLGDFIETDVPNADVVVMDRVVCCYPDWRTLLSHAADRADTAIVMSYPRANLPLRIVHRLMDLWWVIVRSEFRFYVHSIEDMRKLLELKGFRSRVVGHYFWWEILVAQRSA
ncbi:MAG TPA: methyltransferase domain-containing protein [Longimicrobiales bacterium]|nr:methyltransferase domain-containing protein [Longimicrobiales bacterium]